ncbi:MAG: protein BatD [Saprospiraceae bacterium]|nr:protein BatD [Saprospiraceae bacterium]
MIHQIKFRLKQIGKYHIEALALMWWTCVIATSSYAQPVEVFSSLETNRILIGDQVKLNIKVDYKGDVKIQKIDLSVLDTMKTIEVIATSPVITSETGLSQAVTLTSFDSGYHFIPKIPIFFLQNNELDTITSNELALTVNTIPQDTIQLAPIKSIIEEPLKAEDFFWVALAILGIGLIALVILYFTKRKARQKEVIMPAAVKIVPPHEIALQQLKALENKQLWQNGNIKSYHTELTRIIRAYLENRYGIQALEMTTEQILAQLQQLDFDATWNDRLCEMLQAADLVKFAKAEPPSAFHERMMAYAVAFVEATQQTIELENNVE